MPTRPQSSLARPRTAMSTRAASVRPGSTRPGTHMEDMGEWVCAIYQSGGLGLDIGIASFDLISGTTLVTQLTDGQTFPRTLHHLYLHPAVTIIVPDNAVASSAQHTRPGSKTFVSTRNSNKDEPSLLVQCMEAKTGLICEAMPRSVWNQKEGNEKLQDFIIDDAQTAGTMLTLHSKYFALGALSAVYRFLSVNKGLGFAPNSQKIQYQAAEGTMFIDPDTAKNIELVANAVNPRSKMSLLGILDKTQTKMGYRMLKANILQPSTIPHIIQNRLNVVQELIASDSMFNALKAGIKNIKAWDIDLLIAQLSQLDTNRTDARADERRLGQLLALRSILKSLPPLSQALKGCKSELLQTAEELLIDPRASKIEALINARINDDATAHPGKALNQKALKIYAVRADLEPMLDVARGTFKENIEDIHTFRDEANGGSIQIVLGTRADVSFEAVEDTGLSLGLMFKDEGGFLLTIREDELEGNKLPKEFRVVSKKSGKIFFTHEHLLKLNARMKESQQEAFLMSEELVNQLVKEIVEEICTHNLLHCWGMPKEPLDVCFMTVASLYLVSEAISKLDMLLSFAEVALHQRYTRPIFSNTLAIKGGKHPILDRMPTFGCIPNDVYLATDSSAFLLIQGANMAGKSTYLRQVALLTVMAMAGSYIPADYASIKLHDALLARLSNDDSIERSLSTFAQEMATSAMILGLATKDSLVLVDELGRGTAPIEGVAICQAIAEELISRKCYVLFATHFKELSETLAGFPSVDMLHLHSETKKQPNSRFGTTYSYKVVKGSDEDNRHYGLELAKLAALPPNMLEEAERVAHRLDDMRKRGHASSESRLTMIRRKLLLALQAKLNDAVENSTLPDKELREYLESIRLECLSGLRQAVLDHRQAVEECELDRAESQADGVDAETGDKDSNAESSSGSDDD